MEATILSMFGLLCLFVNSASSEIISGDCNKQMRSVYVPLGFTVKLACSPFGVDPSRIVWHHEANLRIVANFSDSGDEIGKRWSRFRIGSDGSLIIYKVQSAQKGLYICQLSQRSCSVTELKVQDCTNQSERWQNPCHHGICNSSASALVEGYKRVNCTCLPQYTGTLCEFDKPTRRGIVFAAPFICVAGVVLVAWIIVTCFIGNSSVKSFDKSEDSDEDEAERKTR